MGMLPGLVLGVNLPSALLDPVVLAVVEIPSRGVTNLVPYLHFIFNWPNKLECLSLESLSKLVSCNTLA